MMKNQRLECLIYTSVWLLVVLVTFHLWNKGVAEIAYELNTRNALLVFVSYALCLFGLIFEKTEYSSAFQKSEIVFIECFCSLSLIVLWFYLGYFIVGLLFSLYIVKMVKLVHIIYLWPVALFTPVVFASLDIYFKSIEFGFESIALYSAFNCLALLYTFNSLKLLNEKNEVRKLFKELKATQILLNENIRRDERLRISRDLHDSMGHNLTALNIQLEIASHSNSEAAIRCIDKAKVISQFLLSDVRKAVTDFRQSLHGGLVDALLKLKENITDIDVVIQVDVDESILDSSHLELIFRCTQESLTNTMKHSNATNCTISVSHRNGELTFLAQDNGQVTVAPEVGNGLRGIKERLARFDGELFYQWSASGFILGFSIPFDRA
jgi:two-component system, NarL family, sensor histidine kinase DesK